jgi:glucosamine kinase
MTAPDDVLVGVDGGATSTRVLVATRDGGLLTRLEGPGSLVRSARPEARVGQLADHVRAALHEAGCQPPARALCCALAGAGRPETRERVENALRRERLAAQVRVIPDVEAAFQDAFLGGDGILLLAGTGSIAVARNAGRVARAGGWGAVFGDEGSAFAMGREALAAVACAHDGRGPATSLTEEVLRHTRSATPDALIAWADRAEKADIAALAPLVLRAADDAVASAIVDTAADQLLAHVRALLSRLGPWDGPPALAFAGGALAPESYLRQKLLQRLDSRSVALTPLDRPVDAAHGALRLAADL